jgi:hypothetical protein
MQGRVGAAHDTYLWKLHLGRFYAEARRNAVRGRAGAVAGAARTVSWGPHEGFPGVRGRFLGTEQPEEQRVGGVDSAVVVGRLDFDFGKGHLL